MASSLFSSLFRRAPQVPKFLPKFPYKIEDNPYRCKRAWPPDFSKLSERHKFRLERKYKRRSKLKWARPNWTKAVTLTQWASVLFVVAYGVLFLKVDDDRTGYDVVSQWYNEQTGVFSKARHYSAADDRTQAATSGPS